MTGDKEVLLQPAAFGEGLSTASLNESQIAVGDMFRAVASQLLRARSLSFAR